MKTWDVIKRERCFAGLAGAAALVLASAWAADVPVASAVHTVGWSPALTELAAYRSLSASQSRNYDRAQDISPGQLVILLEVSERTGASLGQALATGEHESAHTWNDHIRPTLSNGNLGSASGVWQFQPATFHSVLKSYGAQLLAASGADAAKGRDAMDLGEGPFTDETVRRLIQETVDGRRGADDEELQLLRHNFAVLAFAKHYLSLDSGATTPEEDYLLHFMGAGQGRQVLALARGEARNTLSVKPTEPPSGPLDTAPGQQAGEPRIAVMKARAFMEIRPRDVGAPAPVSRGARDDPVSSTDRLAVGSQRRPGEVGITTIRAETGLESIPPLTAGSAVLSPFSFDPPPVSSEWGLPADSPVVTGNLGMFYRDGKGRTEPYTWAEFIENLGRRVRAGNQPALVRAKYGVGFRLNGGDVPGRAFDPEKPSEVAEFTHENGRTVRVPDAMVTGPLNRDETEYYKQRLGALVSQGDDEPTDTLPPETLAAVQHLGMLSADVQEVRTTHPEVRQALHGFRKTVGKDEPDDPAHFDLLMPAERIALEIYDRRLAHYAALQACQQAYAGGAPDLNLISKMPPGLRRPTAPYVATLQDALAEQGLLKQPTRKHVWRDKKRKKHVAYKTVPFAGKPDKATVAALNTFQLRNGLRQTEGVLDAVTLEMLGLPPMGPEIFLPLSGPQCAIPEGAESDSMCEVLTKNRRTDFRALAPSRPRSAPRLLYGVLGTDGSGHPVGSS